MKKRISLVAMTLLMTVALTACGKTETVSVIDDDTTESHIVMTTSVEEPEVSAPVEEQTAPESEVVETEPEVKPVIPPIEEFEYKHDDELGGMVITKYNGSIPMVIIPDEIDGEPVVAIGEYAFNKSKTCLESISMPDTVKLIGSCAFAGCKHLTNIELSSSLEKIEDCALGGCGFSEITLPKSLKCIENNAFNGCENLKSVTVPGDIKTINYCLFEGCTNLESVILSEGITTISTGAFEDCNIKSMKLPDTLVKLENGAFGQTGMTQVVLYFKGEEYSVEKGNMKAIWTSIEENAASTIETSATSETN